jgi:hypothetical protein
MTALLLVLLVASASPDWYNAYERGIGAAKDGRYDDSIQLMTAAIEEKAEESDVARYEKATIKYHPYYYRGYAYLKSGDKKRAADDLGRANGRGDVDFGDLQELREEAGADASTDASPRRHRAVAASSIPFVTRSVSNSVTSFAITEPSYAVGWFTLALINAGLAQAKRRRGIIWFLVSLFLGPIATFFIVVLEPGPIRA